MKEWFFLVLCRAYAILIVYVIFFTLIVIIFQTFYLNIRIIIYQTKDAFLSISINQHNIDTHLMLYEPHPSNFLVKTIAKVQFCIHWKPVAFNINAFNYVQFYFFKGRHHSSNKIFNTQMVNAFSPLAFGFSSKGASGGLTFDFNEESC